MKFDLTEIKHKWRRKIFPMLGMIFASLMLFLFALAGLGPLLRNYTPDEEVLNKEAAVEAGEFIKTVADESTPEKSTLENPHRSNAQVGEWLALAVSDIINFQPDTYDQHVRDITKIADERARTEFHSFITNSNTLDTLTKNNYQLRANTEGDALLLNKGVIDGSYRWLFEVPVLITFLPADAKSYKDTEHLSQHVLVTAQVGRAPYGFNADELVVESFAVIKNPAY